MLYHLDHLGSTQVITDAGGDAVYHIRYAPYGEIRGYYDSAGVEIVNPDEPAYEFPSLPMRVRQSGGHSLL